MFLPNGKVCILVFKSTLVLNFLLNATGLTIQQSAKIPDCAVKTKRIAISYHYVREASITARCMVDTSPH
jgi:hypothetical protein